MARKKSGGGGGQRQLRMGEEIRHVLSDAMQEGHFRDPALYDVSITVTEVRLSPDMQNAVAFVMPLGGGQGAATAEALNRLAPWFRGRIARQIRMRVVPQLKFVLDGSFDYAANIARLLAGERGAEDEEE